jgi:hypothetical protein
MMETASTTTQKTDIKSGFFLKTDTAFSLMLSTKIPLIRALYSLFFLTVHYPARALILSILLDRERLRAGLLGSGSFFTEVTTVVLCALSMAYLTIFDMPTP